MYEFLLILSIFLMGFFTGEAIAILRLRNIIRKLAKAAGIDIEEELRKANEQVETTLTISKLITEVHNDTIYLYDKDNNFICQAGSISELAKLAKEQKQILTAVVLHGNKLFAFKDGLSQEIIELK